jgi:hypothetical protein
MTIAAVAATLLPAASFAAKPSAKAKTAPATYVCSKCHMTYTAAQAKKDHFVDPMDGGKLVPAPTPKKAAPASGANSMGGMKM